MMEIDNEILDQEKEALEKDADLYLDCMNNKTFLERKTEQEKRDGLILFYHVYKFIKQNQSNEPFVRPKTVGK